MSSCPLSLSRLSWQRFTPEFLLGSLSLLFLLFLTSPFVQLSISLTPRGHELHLHPPPLSPASCFSTHEIAPHHTSHCFEVVIYRSHCLGALGLQCLGYSGRLQAVEVLRQTRGSAASSAAGGKATGHCNAQGGCVTAEAVLGSGGTVVLV